MSDREEYWLFSEYIAQCRESELGLEIKRLNALVAAQAAQIQELQEALARAALALARATVEEGRLRKPYRHGDAPRAQSSSARGVGRCTCPAGPGTNPSCPVHP